MTSNNSEDNVAVDLNRETTAAIKPNQILSRRRLFDAMAKEAVDNSQDGDDRESDADSESDSDDEEEIYCKQLIIYASFYNKMGFKNVKP